MHNESVEQFCKVGYSRLQGIHIHPSLLHSSRLGESNLDQKTQPTLLKVFFASDRLISSFITNVYMAIRWLPEMFRTASFRKSTTMLHDTDCKIPNPDSICSQHQTLR